MGKSINYNILTAVLKILKDFSKSPFSAILTGGLSEGVLFVGVIEDLPKVLSTGDRYEKPALLPKANVKVLENTKHL